MNLSETPISCFFCLQDALQSSHVYSCFDTQKKFKTFIKFFTRFVKTDEELKSQDFAVSELKFCDECLNLVNKFGDFYHQYKCLELELDWLVSKIESIMRLAKKVPPKVFQAKNLTNDVDSNQGEGYGGLADFRENLLQNCQKKLEKSLPRLSVPRYVPPLPALFEPIMLNSSNESHNVSSSSANEVCEDATGFKNGNLKIHLEDALISHDDDTNTNRIATEEIDEIINTKDLSLVDHSTEKDSTSAISNSILVHFSASNLATDGTVPTPPLVCKTEPVTDKVIIIDGSEIEETLSFICTSNTNITTKKYNLRRNLFESIKKQIDNDDNDDLDNLSDTSSNSSFSETSSEASSIDDSDSNAKPNILIPSLSKSEKLRKKYKAKYKPIKVYICKSGECNRRFKIKPLYENHLKLHKKGKFSCNFCSKVEPNLVLLSNHELKIHGKTKGKISRLERSWLCPRCPFKATYVSDYEAHFAHTHFGVGMEPPKRRVFEKCKICNRSVWNKRMNSHIKACHDTTMLGDQKFQRCETAGCSAYFVQSWQLRYHNKLEHKTVKEQEPTPKSVNCDICHTPFPNYSSLRQHKNRYHKNQIKNNPTIISKSETEGKTKKQFNCIFCSSIQDHPTELALHEAEKHGHLSSGKSKKTNRCPRCPYEYSLIRALVKHHLHIYQNLLNPECNSACKLCSGGNVYKANSDRHFKNFHLIDEGMESHKCDKCPAYFREALQS